MWFPLGVGGGLLGRYDPVQKRTAGLFWAETHRTTAKPAISRPSERLSGRCHRAADDFPCPKQRPPKPILDKSGTRSGPLPPPLTARLPALASSRATESAPGVGAHSQVVIAASTSAESLARTDARLRETHTAWHVRRFLPDD